MEEFWREIGISGGERFAKSVYGMLVVVGLALLDAVVEKVHSGE